MAHRSPEHWLTHQRNSGSDRAQYPRGRARLEQVLAADDPTGELGAAWGVKEALRLILASHTIEEARAAKTRFDAWVVAADTDETGSSQTRV